MNRVQRASKKFFSRKEAGILIALVVLFALFTFTTPNFSFVSIKNLINILRQVSWLGIMSMGMTMVIVCGEFDLSVGSIFGVSALMTGTFCTLGFPIWISILLGILIGVIIGVINGLLVTYGKIPSFIVTLGMLNIARGIGLVATGGLVVALNENSVADTGLESFFYWGGGGKIGESPDFPGIPIMVIYFVVIAVISWLFFHKTIMGFRMKAVGGNANAAKVAGININIVRTIAFAIVGGLSAISGITALAFLQNVQGTTGQGMELNVIAATVIGGTSVSGGEGTIPGTIIGVLIMGILNNGLVLLGIPSFVQKILVGVVIIGSVALDTWTKNRRSA